MPQSRLTWPMLVALLALAGGLADRPPGAPARAVAWWSQGEGAGSRAGAWEAGARAAGPVTAAATIGDAANPGVAPGARASGGDPPGDDWLPPLLLFGWCSPPGDFITPERMRELKEAGLGVVLPEADDPWTRENNFRRMDAAAAAGLRCWVLDDEIGAMDPRTPHGAARLDGLVPGYLAHPGFLGFYLGDEPAESSFVRLGRLAEALRARAPGRPTFNDMLGRASFATREQFIAHLTAFLDALRPPFLCTNYYPFLVNGDRPGYVENLAIVGDLARSRGIPWYQVIQLVQHGPYRAVTEGELRWQAAQVLAHGGRGICYFTYWTPDPDTFWNFQPAMIARDGARTPYYETVRGLNRELASVGGVLGEAAWMATEYAGSVPVGGTPFAPGRGLTAVEGRAALGHFVEASGRPLLLVVSSDSSAAGRTRLRLAGTAVIERWDPTAGRFVPRPVPSQILALDLPPGGFALLRFPGGYPALESRAGRPVLSVRPNPARGAVRFSVKDAIGAVRIEVLDPSGRRWWWARGPAGESEWEWTGGGPAGAAPAGVYFVRVEDARGVTSMPLAWRRSP